MRHKPRRPTSPRKATHVDTNTPAASSWRNGLSVAQTLITLALAVGGALLTVGVSQGSLRERVNSSETNLEKTNHSLEELKSRTVPRAEHEAHWKADEEFRRLLFKRLDEIRDDVRDLNKSAK